MKTRSGTKNVDARPWKTNDILLLGAYGLAGRTIFDGLLRKTSRRIIAAGRRRDRLDSLTAGKTDNRVALLEMDAADREALRRACADTRLVINAIGPYALHGAEIARIAIESGCSYLDCANEQIHYRRLRELDAEARRRGLLLATAAGVIPGLSTLLAVKCLADFPAAVSLDFYFAQFQHAYQDGGFGSIMGGILDAGYRPAAWRNGKEMPVRLGASRQVADFPQPFGKLRFLEVPTIDTLTIPACYPLCDLHSWFYLGEQPTWLFSLIRLVQPQKRKWAYRLIETLARPLNEKESQQAKQRGLPREALLSVTVRGRGGESNGLMILKDGAAPLATLPVLIARDLLAGKIKHTGLATPLDLLTFDQMRNELEQDIIRVEFH